MVAEALVNWSLDLTFLQFSGQSVYSSQYHLAMEAGSQTLLLTFQHNQALSQNKAMSAGDGAKAVDPTGKPFKVEDVPLTPISRNSKNFDDAIQGPATPDKGSDPVASRQLPSVAAGPAARAEPANIVPVSDLLLRNTLDWMLDILAKFWVSVFCGAQLRGSGLSSFCQILERDAATSD